MNELSGAVALAQTRKLRDIIARRRAAGDLLSELLADNPNVRPQRLLDGCRHTYWQYGMRVEEDAPFTADEFVAALRAEGVSCGAHYIGRPIFLCHDALRNQRLFGASSYPFDQASHPVIYDDTTCPRTQEVLDRMVQPMCPTQFTPEDEVRDIARAIRKVSEGLGR